MYPLSGGALAPLFRVMRRLDGCRDLLCPGIEPTAVRFLCGSTFVRMQGVFCGMHGVREECLPGGCHFCRVFTLREVNSCHRCVAVSEARWLVRRLSLAAIFCSSSVKVVGDVRRLH